MKVGDILICWEKTYITIDIVIDIIDDRIYTNYYMYSIEHDYFRWIEYVHIPLDANRCRIEEFNVEIIKKYFKDSSDITPIYKQLLKDFFDKYKIEGRKYKLNNGLD
jgi:hypothetical protein